MNVHVRMCLVLERGCHILGMAGLSLMCIGVALKKPLIEEMSACCAVNPIEVLPETVGPFLYMHCGQYFLVKSCQQLEYTTFSERKLTEMS